MSAECYLPISALREVFNWGTTPCSDYLLETFDFSWAHQSIGRYLTLLGLTMSLEVPFYGVFESRSGRVKERVTRALTQTLALNLASHPIAAKVLPWIASLLNRSRLESILSSEALAFSLEAYLLARIWKLGLRSVPLSLAANLCSWWLGLEILRYFSAR